MEILNVEIKAKSNNHENIRKVLQSHKADFIGIDHQIDTYFIVEHGRLKLREGNIENNLIHYNRENKSGPKSSKVTLFKSEPESTLKSILTNALGILTIVDKKREIYFIDHVKFHIDDVKGLGQFVEIEAIDPDGQVGLDILNMHCNHYLELLNIKHCDLISESYSDLLIRHQSSY